MQITTDFNKAIRIYTKRGCLPVILDHCQISCQTLFFFPYPCLLLSFYTLWHKLNPHAHASSQPLPGSQQPCSQCAPAFTTHTKMKGFPGPLYLTKILWPGEATFVHLLPADRVVASSLDCRMSVNASHPLYLSLYFPGQTLALAEGLEAS